MNAVQCRACKSYVPNDVPHCVSCGRELTAAAPASSSESSPAIQFFSTLIVALLAWGAYSFLFGGDDAPEAPKTAAEIRQEQLDRSFSAWDGSHYELTKLIKASMNDPDSYEHVETRYADDGDTLRIQTKFRGTNAFGGVVTQTIVAKATLDGEILEILSQQ